LAWMVAGGLMKWSPEQGCDEAMTGQAVRRFAVTSISTFISGL
jgi:hypothetical protein